MQKLYMGFTREQLIFFSILISGIILGLILKYFPSWDKQKVYEQFRQDSLLLANELNRIYSDTVYQSEQEVGQHIDSISGVYKIYRESNSKKLIKPVYLLNINKTTVEELTQINGIGPVLANNIITYRNRYGDFSSDEDLLKVKGIGPAKLKKILPYIKFK